MPGFIGILFLKDYLTDLALNNMCYTMVKDSVIMAQIYSERPLSVNKFNVDQSNKFLRDAMIKFDHGKVQKIL